MAAFFNMDGPVFRALSKLADLLILNVLWLLCCMGIVTIGASTAALYTVTLKMADGSEGYIVRGFFSAFKRNLKQGVVLTVIFLLIASVLGLNLYITSASPRELAGMFGQNAETFRLLVRVPALAGAILLFFIVEFTFPVLAKFDNTNLHTVRNAFLMEVGHIGWFLVISVVNLIPVLVFAFSVDLFFKLMLLWIFIAGAGIAYINSFFFNRIFKPYVEAQEQLEQAEPPETDSSNEK